MSRCFGIYRKKYVPHIEIIYGANCENYTSEIKKNNFCECSTCEEAWVDKNYIADDMVLNISFQREFSTHSTLSRAFSLCHFGIRHKYVLYGQTAMVKIISSSSQTSKRLVSPIFRFGSHQCSRRNHEFTRENIIIHVIFHHQL